MNEAAAAASASPSSLALHSFITHLHRRGIPARSLSFLVVSSFSHPRRPRPRPRSLPRIQRRPFNPNPGPSPSISFDDRDINLSIDLDSISDRATSALARFVRSSRSNPRRFLASGTDAFEDLVTSVRLSPDRSRPSSRILVPTVVDSLCNESVRFRPCCVCCGQGVAGLGFRRRWGFTDERSVVRRDRSLGGREVVVGASRGDNEKRGSENFRVRGNPITDVEGIESRLRENLAGKWTGKKEEELPEWWPESIFKPGVSAGNDRSKREADRLVRASSNM